MAEFKKEFRPEFVNRIDEIIVFHKLTKEETEKILDIMIERVIKRVEAQGIKVEVTNKAKEIILKQGTDDNYGVRPLRKAVQKLVEDTITEAILSDKLQSGIAAKLDEKDGKIVVN
jgi:ATP-dependent Clp protease ATP-binding subunit ClpC